jgi:hypothetical protein
LEPEVETAWNSPVLDLNASDNTPLKPTVSALPLTEANPTIQTADAVKRFKKIPKDMTKIEKLQKFACPFRKRNPQLYSLSEWRSCALSGFNNIARLKYACLY